MKLEKTGVGLVLALESKLEEKSISKILEGKDNLIYQIQIIDSEIRLIELGEKKDACNLSVNITFSSDDDDIQKISNLAHTPFTLNKITYQSVEAFWQGLKTEDETQRLEIANLHGKAAKKVGKKLPYKEFIYYQGKEIRVGTYEHWELMELACTEKFNQNIAAQTALLDTGIRPLYHKPRQDSKVIPGAIMSGLWMNIRSRLRKERNMQSQILTNLK